MIVRNESKWLGDCLESVAGCADELVVVDTGSTDDTVELARRAGATVEVQPWADDFAAPRNRALELAHSDWVLQLDADERLAPGAAPALKAALEQGGFECGLLRLHNAADPAAGAAEVLSGARRLGVPVWLPRVFRRDASLRWQGVVHENVDAWLALQPHAPRALEVDVLHLGAAPAVKAERHKSDRNIRLLTARCAAEPLDAMALGYLALELIDRGDFDASAAVVAEGWALRAGFASGRSLLRLAAARALLALRARDAAQLLDTARVATAHDGPHPDLAFLEGRGHELAAELETGEAVGAALQAAIGCYRRALELASRGDWRLSFQGASPQACSLRCATALTALGDVAGAEAMLGPGPLPPEGVALVAELLLARGRPADALARLEPLMVQGHGRDAWLLAAAAAHRLGAVDDARLLFSRAGGSQPLWAWHRRELGRALARVLGGADAGYA
ncbi:MAG: glycosyltransferase family 2 protein [Archangiaceae bacterium]|nr:glycosyltransferase family 2 protein [Archangiaceae bacterium]